MSWKIPTCITIPDGTHIWYKRVTTEELKENKKDQLFLFSWDLLESLLTPTLIIVWEESPVFEVGAVDELKGGLKADTYLESRGTMKTSLVEVASLPAISS